MPDVAAAVIARTPLPEDGRPTSVAALLDSLHGRLSRRAGRLLAGSSLFVGRVPGDAQPVDQVEPLHLVTVDGALAGAIALAHRHLRRADTDLAVAAGLDEDGVPTAVVLVRETDAVASGEPVLLVVGRTPGSVPDEAATPCAVGDGARDDDRVLLWSGADDADEAVVRHDVLDLLARTTATDPDLPTHIPHGLQAGRVRGAAVSAWAGLPGAVATAPTSQTAPRPVVLLLPGQGSQHVDMARGLYDRDEVFTAAVDGTLQNLGAEGRRIRADWLAGDAATISIDDTRRSQPLIFTVDLALARMLVSWGVRPAGLLGHSAGELVAGVLAEVMTVPDAVHTMLDRVTGAQAGPTGGMLAVAASAAEVTPFLTDPDVTIAAVNAARQVMVAGPTAPLARVAAALSAAGLVVRTVPAVHPFHSPAMAPLAASTVAGLAGRDLQPPRVPVWSGYTGTTMTAADATTPRFWADQVERPVVFSTALDALLATGGHVLVECGAGQTLSSFARRHRDVRRGRHAVVPLLPPGPGPAADQRRAVRRAGAALFREGHDLDPDRLGRI